MRRGKVIIPVVSGGSFFNPPGDCPCNMFKNSDKTRKQSSGVVCQTSCKIEKTPRIPRLTT